MNRLGFGWSARMAILQWIARLHIDYQYMYQMERHRIEASDGKR